MKRDYDILIIDECSTISNQNMSKLLELVEFKLLVLVEDTYQIEAIEFGNWFDAVRSFLLKSAVCELRSHIEVTVSNYLHYGIMCAEWKKMFLIDYKEVNSHKY